MTSTFNIVALRNEDFVQTFEYVDAQGNPIPLDPASLKTKMQIRALENNTSPALFTLQSSTTTAPTGATASPVFFFPTGSTNVVTVFIPQASFKSGGALASLNNNQAYFYDIVVTHQTSAIKDQIVGGRFTVISGVTDI